MLKKGYERIDTPKTCTILLIISCVCRFILVSQLTLYILQSYNFKATNAYLYDEKSILVFFRQTDTVPIGHFLALPL